LPALLWQIWPTAMEEFYYWLIIGVLLLILLLYATVELHYFLRTILCLAVAKLFKKRVHILDTTSVTGAFIFRTLFSGPLKLQNMQSNNKYLSSAPFIIMGPFALYLFGFFIRDILQCSSSKYNALSNKMVLPNTNQPFQTKY